MAMYELINGKWVNKDKLEEDESYYKATMVQTPKELKPKKIKRGKKKKGHLIGRRKTKLSHTMFDW